MTTPPLLENLPEGQKELDFPCIATFSARRVLWVYAEGNDNTYTWLLTNYEGDTFAQFVGTKENLPRRFRLNSR